MEPTRKLLSGFNDLATKNSALAKEYSADNEFSADKIKFDSPAIVNWVCPDCGGIYQSRLDNRKVGDDACPYCNGRKLLSGFNDLATKNPELAKEYSADNEFSADKIRFNSPAIVSWVCPDCGGTYQYRLRDRQVGDDACPYCRNKKVLPGYNSLKATHPELMDEWSERDNLIQGIDPDYILPNSQKPVWWICQKHNKPYRYKMSPARRLMMQKRGTYGLPDVQRLPHQPSLHDLKDYRHQNTRQEKSRRVFLCAAKALRR